MAALNDQLEILVSGDDLRAEGAARGLVAFGESGLRALEGLRHHEKPDTRWWALRALSEFDHPAIPQYFHDALCDEDISVRQCAAIGLKAHPTTAAIPDLIAALNHEDRLYARLAANALIAIGKAAVPSLLDQFENGTHRARIEAVRALAEIGDHRAIGPFFTAIQNGDSPLVEMYSDQGLDKMGIGMAFFKP